MADDKQGLLGQFNAAVQRGSSLIKDPAKVLGGVAVKTSGGGELLPWAGGISGSFFQPQFIDKNRWDKIYPYRLLVIDVEDGNRIVGGGAGGSDQIDVRFQQESSSIVAMPVNKWEFRLPITPEQISVTDQYAINTTATMRGVLEEHGGVRFKMISVQGTTGVWPARPSYDMPPLGTGGIASFLSSTLGAVQNLSSSIQRVKNVVSGKPPYNNPTAPEVPLDQTGYYQAQLLGQFLEQYAEAKKLPSAKGWRLVFDIAKDNTSYVVTPLNFSLSKSTQRPNLHIYQFQLKAWKRIDLNALVNDPKSAVPKLNANTFKNILNGLSAARLAVQNSLDLVKAVRSDFQRPLTILREASLLVKDLAGLPQAVSELPNQIVSDYKSAIMENKALLQSIAINSSSSGLQAQISKLDKAVSGNEGLSLKAVNSGNLGQGRADATSSDPAFNIFQNPETAFELLGQVNLDQLNLNDAQRAAFDAQLELVRLKTVEDLKRERRELRDLALDISNKFGAGSALVNDIYGRPAPGTSIRPMTIEESEILERLWDAIQAFDTLTATTFLDSSKVLNPLQFVGNLAAANGIDFDSSSSAKILVPVPFGLTIEQIAARYLGDRNRYLEIATLNFLREPYIDETGFTRALLSNGSDRQITVADATNLYIGQKVILRSSVVTPFTRTITDIEQISDTTILITLDGAPNLSSLLTADGALMQAYLPGTVNSQDQIYIPTDLPADTDDQIQLPPGIRADAIVGLSKVDLLLTDEMDIAIDSYGDFRYAAGMTNLVQALKIKFSTERGSILAHPSFGLGINPGIMTSDLEIKELFKSINSMVTRDSRYAGVDQMQVRLNGPILEIGLLIELANRMGVVPITFMISSQTGQAA
jgi:hypothetical protein